MEYRPMDTAPRSGQFCWLARQDKQYREWFIGYWVQPYQRWSVWEGWERISYHEEDEFCGWSPCDCPSNGPWAGTKLVERGNIASAERAREGGAA
jgi:hypothetical protein